jgi:chromosome segregation ATPase
MPKDIDAKLESKQAEFETLSRATAALLEQHEKLRLNFDEELKGKASNAKLSIDKALKTQAKTLKELESSLVNKEEALKALEERSILKERELEEQDKRLEREKGVILEIVARLNSEKLTLEGEKTLLTSEKTSLMTDIDRLHTELADTQEKVRIITDQKSVLELNLEQANVEFDFQKATYDREEELSKKRLSLVNSQLNDAARSLHEVKTEEDTIRSDLADLSMQLGKREQAINAREAKVAQQEKRVFNYTKFTGL